MFELTDEPIDYSAVVEAVRTERAGAVVLFLGTVRERTGDKRTESLDYEAYPEMARAKLAEVAEQVRRKWSVEKVAVVHRLGHMKPGEVSVAVAVSSAHRQEAFQAAREFMDLLKQVVPIWKKENWADGTSEWVHPSVPPSAGTDKPSG